MRKIFFLLLTATFLWSCQNQNFTIQGTVADPAFEGANVYLLKADDDLTTFSFIVVETTVVHNGAFTFTGEADESARRRVSLSEVPTWGAQDHALVILERGTIEVTFGNDDVTTIGGTRLNILLNDFQTVERQFNERLMVFVQRFNEMNAAGTLTDELAAEIIAEHGKINEERLNFVITFIRDNIENEVGRWVFRGRINSFEPEIQKEFIALLPDEDLIYPTVAPVIARLENARNVAVGQRFTDFTLPNPEGNEVSLSDFAGQGNYTLIVFWATWCGPCIQSVPQLREIYARYQNREFQMVGVSFDRSHDALVNGIRELNITWPQMVDLNRENSTWDLYAIRGIPHTVLLDREGYIIANSLRGEALNNKLAELMP